MNVLNYKRIDRIDEISSLLIRILCCIFGSRKLLNPQLYEESLHESRVANYSNKQRVL